MPWFRLILLLLIIGAGIYYQQDYLVGLWERRQTIVPEFSSVVNDARQAAPVLLPAEQPPAPTSGEPSPVPLAQRFYDFLLPAAPRQSPTSIYDTSSSGGLLPPASQPSIPATTSLGTGNALLPPAPSPAVTSLAVPPAAPTLTLAPHPSTPPGPVTLTVGYNGPNQLADFTLHGVAASTPYDRGGVCLTITVNGRAAIINNVNVNIVCP